MAFTGGTTYSVNGHAEDFADVIYNISPEETPFVSGAGRGPKADNSLFQWQTDSLAAPAANAAIEGADASFAVPASTTTVANYTQISTKTVSTSGTEEAVKKYGRKSEHAYQLAKRGKELKRDIEYACIGVNQAAVVGSTVAARKTASLLAFIRTNVTNMGAGGANPGAPAPTPGSARTDGATSAIDETKLKTAISGAWSAGVVLDTLMVGASVKQTISGFAGVATKTVSQVGAKKAVIVGAADIYVSDFGTLTILPNRWQRSRDVFGIDWDFVSLSYLREIQRKELAVVGDSKQEMLLAEWGLRVGQEAALFLIADVA